MYIHTVVRQRVSTAPELTVAAGTHYCYCLFHGAARMLGPWPSFSAAEGFLALLRPGQTVRCKPLDGPLLCDFLEFTPENDEIRLLSELPLPVSPTIPPNLPELSNRIRVIEEVYFSVNKYRREINNADFLLLLYGTASGDEDDTAAPQRSRRHLQMRRLRTLIFDDPLRFRTVQDGADYLHLSPSYFSNLYRECFGVTFLQDCIRSRVKRCCSLLTSTDLSIKEIAQKLGHDNEAHFFHQFKQITGQTPNEYRRHNTKAF